MDFLVWKFGLQIEYTARHCSTDESAVRIWPEASDGEGRIVLNVVVVDALSIAQEVQELQHWFLAVVETKERGAKGQDGCFAEALAAIYPKEREISPQNVIEFLKKFHIKEETE